MQSSSYKWGAASLGEYVSLAGKCSCDPQKATLDIFRDSYPINVSHLNCNSLCLLLLYVSISLVQSHNCLLLKDLKWKERHTFCCCLILLPKSKKFPSMGLDDRPLFSKKQQRQKSSCYYSCIILGHPSFTLYTEMVFIKVQFRQGCWTYSWDFSDLRFLPFYVFAILHNAIQEPTWVFFIDWFFV
jgi:hypothetical protein